MHMLRVIIEIDLDIGAGSVFITGRRQPFLNDADFKILNGSAAALTGKDRPCGGGNDILFQRIVNGGTGYGDIIDLRFFDIAAGADA